MLCTQCTRRISYDGELPPRITLIPAYKSLMFSSPTLLQPADPLMLLQGEGNAPPDAAPQRIAPLVRACPRVCQQRLADRIAKLDLASTTSQGDEANIR